MKSLIAAATLALGFVGVPSQGLSPAEISAAIADGTAGKTLRKTCDARAENGFDFVAEGPIGRIMRAAKDAKRAGKDFTQADVTAVMAAPELSVSATRFRGLSDPPRETDSAGSTREYRTSFVLRSRPAGSEDAIVLNPVDRIRYDHRRSTTQRVVIVKGAAPADVESLFPLAGSDMRATFDLAAFRSIPRRDIDIVVFMSDTGEHKCRISESERVKLK